MVSSGDYDWVGHYILQHWFLSCSLCLLFSSSILSGRMSIPYFPTWCGLSANLECRLEMCCRRLAENTERKNSLKIRHLRTVAQFCWAMSSRLRRLGFVTAPMSFNGDQPKFANDVRPSHGLEHCIHFRGSYPSRIFARCKIDFASKSCVLIYW